VPEPLSSKKIFQRTFDIVTIGLSLPVILPVMALVALLVKKECSGEILFRQHRVGLNQRIFKLYKFRTMIENAEQTGTSVTTRKDPRITPLGRILRKTKIDELPQLINVFGGDMSFVGPRPEVPEIVKNYTPKMRRIFSIRPGITSVATLHLRDEEDILASTRDPDKFYEEILVPLKVRLAMEHVERSSFAFDLKVLCQTVWMVSLGRWWPISEHRAVSELKKNMEKESREMISKRLSLHGRGK